MKNREMPAREVVESNNLSLLMDSLKTDARYRPILDISKEFEGASVFVVGGAVRDSLIGRQPKDIDFVVAGVPAAQLEKYLRSKGRLKLTGKRFAVYKFVPSLGAATESDDSRASVEEIEIALPRTERASGQGGYRDVKVQSDPDLPIEQDLGRRDFTINAMALDTITGKLIDPFGGQQDIRRGLIRAVGDPKKRFSEDYSRMLRAVRFASKYNFSLDKKTSAALKRLAPRINALDHNGERIVARELIGREFIWAYAFNPAGTLEILDQHELLKEILPEVSVLKEIRQYKVFHPEGDVFKHVLLMLERVPADSSLDLKISILFHDLGKARAVQIKDLRTNKRAAIEDPPAFFKSDQYDPETQRVQNIGHAKESVFLLGRQIIKRLRLTQFGKSRLFNLDTADVLHNVRHHLLADIARMRPSKAENILFKKGKLREDLLELARLDVMNGDYSRYRKALAVSKKMLVEREKHLASAELPAPLINGNDLIKLGFEPGKIFAIVLADVRDWQLEGLAKNKEQVTRMVQDKYKK